MLIVLYKRFRIQRQLVFGEALKDPVLVLVSTLVFQSNNSYILYVVIEKNYDKNDNKQQDQSRGGRLRHLVTMRQRGERAYFLP